MADAVAIVTVFQGKRRISLHLTNRSDATGEADVLKLDISTLTGPTGGAVTKLILEEVQYSIQGFTSVELQTDHTTDDVLLILSAGSGYMDFRDIGGLNKNSAGDTGDLLLTTFGATATSTYDITLTFRMK